MGSVPPKSLRWRSRPPNSRTAPVTNAKIANDSVSRGKIQGGYSNGSISVSLGLGADTCSDFDLGVPGVVAGDIPIFALQSGETLPQKMLIIPLNSPSAGVVTVRICNFAAVTQAFSNLDRSATIR